MDRRLLAELDHTEGVQLVKVPVSDAEWSTWRRYCDAAGVSMGRGLAVLLHQELAAVVDEDLEGLAARLTEQEARLVTQEAEFTEREQVLGQRAIEVAAKERRLAGAIQRLQADPTWRPPKMGRNEQCWCGSGRKFKTCHGTVT
ncbi:MAG: SEC-C domain-containing protein [Acidimicrobiia bacterium]|nr:SEC-C domain-containing protein [Acidimicrobiia bacterium]